MRNSKQFVLVTVLLAGVILAGCGGYRPVEPATGEPTLAVDTVVPTFTPINTVAPTKAPGTTVLVPENLSAGDPYAPELGNAGYDVQHYTLELALDPASAFVDGRVIIDAASTMDELGQISLDFVGFEIGEVSLAGAPLSFFRQGKKLIVDLPEPLAVGAPFTLDIAYSGEPAIVASDYVPFVSHLGLFTVPDDSLFVISEPDGARYWFPSNDHPRDKAMFRFELIVPEGMTGVANGVLVETQTDISQALPGGADGDLYVWQHDYPVATALVTVAVGDYVRMESVSPGGVLLRHYVSPERQAEFEQVEATIGEMMDWMSDLLGPYPFEAFGFVTVTGLGASLETQTMVILSENSINEGTMSHEMAHMWFGDWVNLDSWGTMWRNEGFATYISYMWDERDDPGALDHQMEGLAQSIAANESGYPLNDPPPEQLFGRDSYSKGAVVAHALRQEMGDEAFFDGLRAYFELYGGGAASDAEFQAVMEAAAGVSLDGFFEGWFE